VTQSGWRLSAVCGEGEGAIVRIDASSGPLFRGEGVFLGWSPQDLETAYQALRPRTEEPDFPLNQLG
jgi:hypothetical protein